VNEQIRGFEKQCWDHQSNHLDTAKFAELIYKDIISVVAAQALLGESALDVFKNLQNIYEKQ